MAKAVKKKNLVMRSTDPAPTKQTLPYDPSKGRKIEKLTTASKGGATSKAKSTAPTIDKQSVLNMGYGPISGKTLADKVASGKVTMSTTNGVTSFKKAPPKPVGVTAGATGVSTIKKPSSGASSGKMRAVAVPRNATRATSSGNAGRTAGKNISANKKLY